MSSYWTRREVVERERLLDMAVGTTEAELKRQYLRVSDSLINRITSLYNEIMDEQGKPSTIRLYQYNRYYDLLNNMNEELTKLGIRQNSLLDMKLTKLYKDNSEIVGKNLHIATDVSVEKTSRVVNQIWVSDGLNWSDRIWRNKDALVETLKNGLVDSVSAGVSTEELTRTLMERFSASYSEARRLARTELAHIQVQSTVDKYKEAGIMRFRWLTASGCCEDCQELDGQEFELDNTDAMPPLHPQCRCSILAVMEED